jgi:hypothetical protein
MVIPVNEYKLPYKDVYTLNLQASPPPEVWRSLDANRQAEINRLYFAPKVMHLLRIKNSASAPITTAPALVIRDGRVLAQGMTTYTPPGGEMDLTLPAAVDVQAKKTARETGRTPTAARYNNTDFFRVDADGQITLTNRRSTPVKIEVRRAVLGIVDKISDDGDVQKLNPFDNSPYGGGIDVPLPPWWSWYSWPSWWSYYNSVNVLTWKTAVDPGKEITLTYNWHYFWP